MKTTIFLSLNHANSLINNICLVLNDISLILTKLKLSLVLFLRIKYWYWIIDTISFLLGAVDKRSEGVQSKLGRITRPRLAIQQKFAASENICVWTYKKRPRVIRLESESYFDQTFQPFDLSLWVKVSFKLMMFVFKKC